jgi:hypothetical protein
MTALRVPTVRVISTTIRRTAAVAGAVLLAWTCGAAPAQADARSPLAGGQHGRGGYVQEPGPYSFEETFDPECPGLGVSGHFEIDGVSSVRALRGTGGQAFLLRDRYSFRETWTEAGTGREILTISGQYLFQEQSATLVPNEDVPAELIPPGGLVGPVYRFIATETGHDSLTDGAGRTIYTTAGTVTFANLFDTLGDSAPGGRSLSFDIVNVVGPHPLLDADVCAIAADLVTS